MIPIAKVADRSQVEALRPLLAGRRVAVVGSAPLPTPTAVLEADELAVAVNGAISSLPGAADLWVVNSKLQDKPGDPLLRPLHRTMLAQATGRSAARVLFLRGPKVASEGYTLATLAKLGTVVGDWSVLDKTTKLDLEREQCNRVRDNQPCSAGILTATIALVCGAEAVRLVGFSFTAGYHYLPKGRPSPWWRDHVEADGRALKALFKRYPGRLSGALVPLVAGLDHARFYAT